MQLAASPLWQNLLLEDPWPLALTLLVVAAVVVFLAFQRANTRLLRFAGLAVLLAVGVFLLAKFVITTTEHILENTRKLVSYTAPLQLADFKALVDPRVVVLVEETANPEPIAGRDVFDSLEKTVESSPLEKQTIVAIEADVKSDDEAVSSFDVRTNLRGGGMFITRWTLTWRRQGDNAWRVVEVRWLPCPHPVGVQPSRRYLR